MFQTFLNAFKIPNLRSKILFTVFMIAIVRLGDAIPIPGVNPEVMANFFNSMNGSLDIFNAISGSTLQNMTLFSLGVLPYINASIIIQLLTVAIPALEKAAKEEDGKKKINQYTRYLGVILAVIQAAGITFAFIAKGILVGTTSIFSIQYLSAVITLTVGASVMIWVGDRITEKGIGNGISLLIFANILSKFPLTLATLWASLNNPVMYAIVIALFIAIIAFVVIVQEGERRIPVEYAKRAAGNKFSNGQKSNIPIKANLTGVMPIIFASSILQVPQAIQQFVNASGRTAPVWFNSFMSWFNMNHPIGATLYIAMIVFFAYFYTTIQFNPIEFAENMKKSGGIISGIRPGQPTVEFITHVLNYITLVGSVFLAIIAFIPVIAKDLLHVNSLYFGGTSLLIAVGVALDILRQVEANMVVRHYKGFLD